MFYKLQIDEMKDKLLYFEEMERNSGDKSKVYKLEINELKEHLRVSEQCRVSLHE